MSHCWLIPPCLFHMMTYLASWSHPPCTSRTLPFSLMMSPSLYLNIYHHLEFTPSVFRVLLLPLLWMLIAWFLLKTDLIVLLESNTHCCYLLFIFHCRFSRGDLLATQSLCSLAVLKQCRMVYWSRIRSLCPFPWSEWLTCQRKAPSIFDWHCLFSSKCQPWLLPHPWIGTHLSIYLFVRCYRNVHHCMWRSTTIQSWCSRFACH